MSETLTKQILIALAVAVFVRLVMAQPANPALLAMNATNDIPVQTWMGAGTDPFGMSYTVAGKATRGGL